jgi:hypothetical protein
MLALTLVALAFYVALEIEAGVEQPRTRQMP